jgi:hypothetical protein
MPSSCSFRRTRNGPLSPTALCSMYRAVSWGHRGEEVSFDSFLRRYELADPALELLAHIVRTADSKPSNPHPAGEGLRWIAHVFSALGFSDDEILDREFIVYDALYAECQRQVAAKG